MLGGGVRLESWSSDCSRVERTVCTHATCCVKERFFRFILNTTHTQHIKEKAKTKWNIQYQWEANEMNLTLSIMESKFSCAKKPKEMQIQEEEEKKTVQSKTKTLRMLLWVMNGCDEKGEKMCTWYHDTMRGVMASNLQVFEVPIHGGNKLKHSWKLTSGAVFPAQYQQGAGFLTHPAASH